MPSPSLSRDDISGLVLAGGRGSRMGGVDKGLQDYRGQPLAQQALQRLAPQVGRLMLNANRNLDRYQAFGVPVWPDAEPDYPGPLAGFLAGLTHCETPYLVTVPCDSPHFPATLVERLAQALAEADAEIAMAVTHEDGRLQPQPVFCLLKTALSSSLQTAIRQGERKIDRWTARQRQVQVLFEDSAAFFNANTLDELAQAQRG